MLHYIAFIQAESRKFSFISVIQGPVEFSIIMFVHDPEKDSQSLVFAFLIFYIPGFSLILCIGDDQNKVKRPYCEVFQILLCSVTVAQC